MVMWQDYVLMTGGFVFAPALIISIIRRAKLPLTTSIPTGLALTTFAGCYVTLGLYLAALSTALTALCWYILAFRRGR